LTEAASRHGLGLAVPRWLKWGGWPFVAFALTTVFGQLVSVYQYPAATLLVLGGSTLAALASASSTAAASASGAGTCVRSTAFSRCSRACRPCIFAWTPGWTANMPRIRVHPVNCAPLVRIRG
jgi:hypothetical protein